MAAGELRPEQTRRLLFLRGLLQEARRKAVPTASVVDRATAILLIGQAVELALTTAQGEFRVFEKALDDFEEARGQLPSRGDAQGVWRAQVGVQHSGVVPDGEATADLVRGASHLCADVVLRAMNVTLEEIRLSSIVELPAVRRHLETAESSLGQDDLQSASVAIAKARSGLSLAASILARRQWGFGARELSGLRRRDEFHVSSLIGLRTFRVG